MKKIYLTLITSLSVFQFAYAQFTPDGLGNYYLNSGDIAIGTTTFNQKLTVNGNITLSGSGFYEAGTNNWFGSADALLAGAATATDLGIRTDGNIIFMKGSGYESARFDLNGNLGIGTTNPGSVLSIINSTPLIQLFDKDANPHDGSSEGKLAFGALNSEYASIEASRFASNYDDVSLLKFKTSWATGAGGDGLDIERMRILYNGNVGIGTTNPQNKLDVKGTIHSQQVNVDMNGWSDYVFKKGYGLPALSNVKTYIDKNHHLPEIPSEQQIEKDGLNLGEMNKLLVKKVEELTLYLIEQNKRIEKLESQLLIRSNSSK